ncbi:hypothetical protein BN1843_28120 [Escherichia coli]|nr:hypothetical protein BN1843_28120 [Escherichia coli]
MILRLLRYQHCCCLYSMIFGICMCCLVQSYVSTWTYMHMYGTFNNRFQNLQEEKPLVRARDAAGSNMGRKRSVTEDSSDLAENDDVSGKRVRSTPSVSEESTKELNRNTTTSQGDICSTQPTINKGDVDTGPVQQLVAMFGALVAQGEKAVGSLGILISSISADLLAEVVMANMRNLPPDHPHTDGDDELLENMSIVGSDTQAKYPPSFLADVVSLSSTFPPIASLLNSQLSVSNKIVV